MSVQITIVSFSTLHNTTSDLYSVHWFQIHRQISRLKDCWWTLQTKSSLCLPGQSFGS